ncbi:MAG: FAD-linked oxidase C-terminal domain-containing protein [Candidatus Aenigmatarchaeota archaeon]
MANIYLKLVKIFGNDRALFDEATLETYSYDARTKGPRPIAVVFPKSTAEASNLVKLAEELKIPLVARGAGSSAVGGAMPIEGSIVVCFSLANAIKKISMEDRVAIVEPGVITKEIQKAAERIGLFYPPDPASSEHSTIGGNIATNAGGLRAVKYGVTRNYVLSLEVVTGGGRIIDTGPVVLKDAVGYDLTSLFIGAEGTLGLITEVRLRLLPKPDITETILAEFTDIGSAIGTSLEILNVVTPCAIEIVDNSALDVADAKSRGFVSQNCRAALLVELDGTEAQVSFELEKVSAILNRCALTYKVAKGSQEREALWSVRRGLSSLLHKKSPYKVAEDISVLPSQIPEFIASLDKICGHLGLEYAVYGHVGDGNLHVNLLPKEQSDPRVETARASLFEEAWRLAGSISGEHGIGSMKVIEARRQLGYERAALMREVKKIFDPHCVFNPKRGIPL